MFVAVDLPESLNDPLAELVGELRRAGADVRWVDPGSMHLTLKFLGSVADDEVGRIDEALRRVARGAPSTTARLRGLGSFPHLRRPRVIWVGLQPAGERLAELQSAVDAAFAELGFDRERRRFHPHVTLGRVKGGRNVRRLAEAVGRHQEVDLGTVSIDEMVLFESRKSPRGARYTPVGTYRLAG